MRKRLAVFLLVSILIACGNTQLRPQFQLHYPLNFNSGW